jgi:hypothetical protein
MRVTGVLHREQMVDTVWVLRTADADYQLTGKIPAALEGKRVQVTGSESGHGFGFSMVGAVLKVRSIEAV